MNKSEKNLTEKKELKLSNKKAITELDNLSTKLRKHALDLGLLESHLKHLNTQAEVQVLDHLKDKRENLVEVAH